MICEMNPCERQATVRKKIKCSHQGHNHDWWVYQCEEHKTLDPDPHTGHSVELVEELT